VNLAQRLLKAPLSLDGIVGAFRATKTSAGTPRDPVLREWFEGGGISTSGVSVSAETARKIVAVFACIRVLSETLAMLPLHVYERTNGGKGKRRDDAHPLYDLLHFQPNDWQTSFEWRETGVGHTGLRGAAYSALKINDKGWFDSIEVLHPDYVTPMRTTTGKPAFKYQPLDGTPARIYSDAEILRFPSWSDDGRVPLSPIAMHRDTFGQAQVVSEYGARVFANSAMPKGAISLPQTLGDEAVKLLRDSWERRHQGTENAGRLAILDGGMTWAQIGMTNDDVQFIDSRKLSVIDICRIFRVPPHMVMDLERATFSNIEHQAIMFVVNTLMPYIVRMEQRMNRTLLLPENRKTHFVAFDLKGLLRGDATTRSAFYDKLFRMGVLSPNDIRRLEDMDEITGGDVYYLPTQLAPADKLLDVLLKAPPGALAAPPPNDPGAPPQ
jgi:HK97 family phage portal protein